MKKLRRYSDYFITESGEVWSKKSGSLQMLHPFRKKEGGELYVTLWKDGCAKIVRVSKLMSKTFMDKPKGTGYKLVHIDGDVANNNLGNLVYISKH